MLDYFSRQSTVQGFGKDGLKRLQSASVAIVGTGGVGSAAGYFLASLGIGKLRLIDQDIVEETNLHRLVGVDHQDLHTPKAEALAGHISKRHPWTRLEPVVETLRAENCAELLDNPDVVVDGTDNLRARYVLNKFAAKRNAPYLFTSAIANQGHLSLFASPETACLECLMPEATGQTEENCETLGVTPTITSIIGSIAAAESAKRILGLPTRILGNLLTVDLAGPDFVYSRITKKENCTVCGKGSPDQIHYHTVTVLCGDNVANVLPKENLAIDARSLESKIPKERVIASTDSVFVYWRPPHKISVFKTGRLLIGNVSTEEAALQIANEVWKEAGLTAR